MKFDELQEKVVSWAIERDIVKHSTPRAQLLKAMSEFGELADAEGKGNLDDIQDGIGDTLVCLIIYSHFYGLTLSSCLELAYNEIKNRKGTMIPGGVFVKEEK